MIPPGVDKEFQLSTCRVIRIRGMETVGQEKKNRQNWLRKMAGILSSSPLITQTHLVFHSQNPWRTLNSSFLVNIEKRAHTRCSAKKKIGFVDQILDYIEGFSFSFSNVLRLDIHFYNFVLFAVALVYRGS